MRSPRLPRTLLALIALSGAGLAQTTWYVDVAGTPPGDGSQANPYTAIQYALDQPTTLHGDTLLVAPGIYVENLSLSKRVRIEGIGGADLNVLRAAAPGVLVHVTALDIFPQAGLVGFTLDGSAFPDGTGIRMCCGTSVSLHLARCVVREFSAGRGIHDSSCFVDSFQTTISRNAVGVHIDPNLHFGQVTLAGGILRGNGVDLTGHDEPFYAYHANVPVHLVDHGFANQSAPPRFWSHAHGDLHLAPGSPCIDALPVSSFPPDPDGSPADQGALTFDPDYAHGPVSYCQAKVSSLGCAPGVSWTGSASASGTGGFVATAGDVLSQVLGVAIYSLGDLQQPFQGGTLCVTPPVVRAVPQGSGGSAQPDCSGSLAFDLDAWLAAGPHPELTFGALVHLQFWYRDPGDPFGSGLSDALRFGLAQ